MSEEEIIDNWLNMRQQQPIQLATQDAYWQHYRIQAAIAAMQATITNYEFYAEGINTECQNSNTTSPKVVAIMAVELADALVAELKKKDNVYAEARRLSAIDTASMCENLTNLRKKGG